MTYLVAVLSDRIKAEEAYSALERESFPMANIAILGRGYQSVEEFGLEEPTQKAAKQAKRMAIWLIPFGFIGGVGFSLTTQLDTFAWAGEIGNHIVGGLLGAIGGAMGGFFIGGGPALVLPQKDESSYGDRIAAGQYLLAVRGTEMLIGQVGLIMRRFQPETLEVFD